MCLILIATNRHTDTQRHICERVCVCVCVVSFNFSAYCFRSGNTALPVPAPSSLLFLPVFFLPSHMFSVSLCASSCHPHLSLSLSLLSIALLPFNSFSICCCNWWCGSLIASARSSNICSTLFNYILPTHYAHTHVHACCVRVNVPLYPFTRTQFRRKVMAESERARAQCDILQIISPDVFARIALCDNPHVQ